MNKRGQGWEIASAFIMLGITITGIFIIIESNNIYFADKSVTAKIYYDYQNCKNKLNNIAKDNFITFKSENEAIVGGYTKYDKC